MKSEAENQAFLDGYKCGQLTIIQKIMENDPDNESSLDYLGILKWIQKHSDKPSEKLDDSIAQWEEYNKNNN